jgi:hypothetical protein
MRPDQGHHTSKETGTMDTKRRVKVGEEIQVALPGSEVCHHLKVVDHLRTIRILEHTAQILNDDGTDFSFPIGHGEAGVRTDSEGLYVEPLPDTLWQVYQYGKPVSPLMAHENGCFVWTLKHQGQSVDYALRDGGYSWKQVPREEPVTEQAPAVESPATYEEYERLVRSRYGDPHNAAGFLPSEKQFADWGFRYWTEVLEMPAEREHSCEFCGKPFGH